MDSKKIGIFLKTIRKEKGLTQEQLAEILSVSGRTVSRWETGINMPDLSILIQIADYYDIEINDILGEERKSGNVNSDLKETLNKVADYASIEKEQAKKIGSISFSVTFIICAAVIILQLIIVPKLYLVFGETRIARFSLLFFASIACICFIALRFIAFFNHKSKKKIISASETVANSMTKLCNVENIIIAQTLINVLKENDINAYSQESSPSVVAYNTSGFGLYGIDIYTTTANARKASEIVEKYSKINLK